MRARALIIGGGVTGLSAAWELLQQGHQVTVLERGALGGESSWAGGGILSPLLPWDYSAPVIALATRAMSDYADWVTTVEAASRLDTQYWRCGMLVAEPARVEAAIEWCQTHAVSAQLGCPAPLRLAPRVCERDALWLPDIAQVRNPRLIAALRVALERRGAVVREHAAVTGVRASGRAITALEIQNAQVACDLVVLATGAWGGLPLAALAPAPGIRPIRGQMLLFKLEPGALETILYRDGLYVIPRRDGHVLVGSTLEDVGFDKRVDDATCERLHAEAAQMLPQLAQLQPIKRWAGLRPGSPDNIPVIDRHPDFDNVYVSAGHFRYGVTMAPASAELLADLIEGRAPALDPAPYTWQAALERRWPEPS